GSVAVVRPSAVRTYADGLAGLSADSQRVAFVVPSGLAVVRIWSGGKTALVGHVDFGCDSDVESVVLAGKLVAAECIEDTLSIKARFMQAGVVNSTIRNDLAESDQSCANSCLGNAVGRHDILVFNTWRR